MRICPRCGKSIPDGKSCDCFMQEFKWKMDYETKYMNPLSRKDVDREDNAMEKDAQS